MKAQTLLVGGAALLIFAAGPVAVCRAAEEAQDMRTGVEERVNINTATETELVKLSGIGRGVAKRIIEYRQTHGEFKKPEDIRKVSGVGKGLWERNRDRIVVK